MRKYTEAQVKKLGLVRLNKNTNQLEYLKPGKCYNNPNDWESYLPKELN